MENQIDIVKWIRCLTDLPSTPAEKDCGIESTLTLGELVKHDSVVNEVSDTLI